MITHGILEQFRRITAILYCIRYANYSYNGGVLVLFYDFANKFLVLVSTTITQLASRFLVVRSIILAFV